MNNCSSKLLSIVVPYYNVPVDMLDKCLASLVSGRCRSCVEVVVVDDGSSVDISGVRADARYADVRFVRQENRGLGGARNTGVENSHGRYVMFVDSDDYLVSGAVDTLVGWIQANDAKSVPSDLLRFEHAGVTDESVLPPVPDSLQCQTVGVADYYMCHNIKASACSVVFRRSLLDDARWGELRFVEHTFHEDEHFTPLLMARAVRADLTQAELYAYRRRSGSIMHSHDTAHLLRRSADFMLIIDTLCHNAAMQTPFFSRKVHQQAFDLVYNQMRMGLGLSRVEQSVEWLAARHLYPFAAPSVRPLLRLLYSMCNCRAGRMLLYALARLLP